MEYHEDDNEDDNVLAARIGLHLADENTALHKRLKEALNLLEAEKDAREELEEQLASLSRQHTASVQRRLREVAQQDSLVRSFQEKETQDATTIANLTRQVATLQARSVAATQAMYAEAQSEGDRHGDSATVSAREAELERALQVVKAENKELSAQLAWSESRVGQLQTEVEEADNAREAADKLSRLLRSELRKAQDEIELLLREKQEYQQKLAAVTGNGPGQRRSYKQLPTLNLQMASVGTNTDVDLVTISRAELRELELTKRVGQNDIDQHVLSPPDTPSGTLGHCLDFETSFHSIPGDLSIALMDEGPSVQATPIAPKFPQSPREQPASVRRLRLENTLLLSQLKQTRRIIAANAASAAAAKATAKASLATKTSSPRMAQTNDASREADDSSSDDEVAQQVATIPAPVGQRSLGKLPPRFIVSRSQQRSPQMLSALAFIVGLFASVALLFV